MNSKDEFPVLTRVAEALECAELASRGIGFNMSGASLFKGPDFSGKDCGTVCCIAGWAEELGLDENQLLEELCKLKGDSLILPWGWGSHPERYPIQLAARVVRRAIRTKEVNWDGEREEMEAEGLLP